MGEEKLYWLAFSALVGVGPKRFALLKNYFGSAQRAWLAKGEELRAVGLGGELIKRLEEFRKNFDPASYFLRLRENKINPLFLDDKRYPEALKRIDNPPFVLYVQGEILPGDDFALAVVGSRLVTGYGRRVTEKLVGELVDSGLTIVSGLARGVDSLAHQTALSAGGRTIGVLGCGSDLCYPPENKFLKEKIVNGRGAVVSEYPLGSQALPGNFPARNRLIAGLSLGVLVVEGAIRSGSLITARLAAEQGREVFAVPGPITSRLSEGPASLIKKGAKLIFEAKDILEELKPEKGKTGQKRGGGLPESKDEALISFLIRDGAKSLDQIVKESGLEAGRAAGLLSMMETKGRIRNLGDTYLANQEYS